MATIDINGMVFYETTDPVTPLQNVLNGISTAVTNAFDSTDRVFKVADATARNTLYATRGATSSNPLTVLREDTGRLERTYNGSTWKTVSPVAEWFGTATSAADGSFSGTIPSGVFSVAPLIFGTVQSTTQFTVVSVVASSATAFSGLCGYFPGFGGIATTAGFVIGLHAVQAKLASASD